MYKKWQIILTLSLVLLISACDQKPSNTNKSESHKTVIKDTEVSVVDSQGTTITLEKPAQRIIALAPHIVENVYSAGAGDRLVGVVSFSDYPEQAKKLPIVGGYKALNLERIIELKPDLILAWESGNSHNSYTRLQELGFTVYVDQPHELKDVVKSIIDIGVLSDTQVQAKKVTDDYQSALNKIQLTYKDKPKVTSFYQVWNQPLRTISSKSIITDAMAICGGINIYHDEIPIAFFVDPDHIQRHTVRLLLAINTICQQLDTVREKSNL